VTGDGAVRNCWAHASVCTHYYAIRLIECNGKNENPPQSAIGLSWHPFVGNSQQRINHQSGFCSTKAHSSVLGAAWHWNYVKGNMISLVFCTFVTLNYSYRIIKTSSRLVSCPGEPVLNHKMAHTRKKTLRERELMS